MSLSLNGQNLYRKKNLLLYGINEHLSKLNRITARNSINEISTTAQI